MDTRRCFPNYHMGDYFQPSPSHWPLSHIRSSVSSQDDSSELDTFELNWVGEQATAIPYQERTIINLTGRSWQESFARLERNRSSPFLESPPRPATPREPEAQYSLSNDCSSSDEAQPSAIPSRLGDQEMEIDATNEFKETETPTQLGSHPCKRCDMRFARDPDLQRHNQKHEVEMFPTDVKASTTCMPIEDIPSSPRSLSIQREKTPQPPHLQPNQAAAHKPEPTIVSQLSSYIHIQAQDSITNQQASISQCTTSPPLFPRERSEDDNYAMRDNESSSPRVKKPKQKSNQQGSHLCKVCDITFTRHFDLLRHNQKHQVETEEDMARRTCTNCDKILSRVDATKRHVDTLPESCNYLRRKQALSPLPAMPTEHYDACRERYYKLAQERKKPKGRKKANPAA